MNASTRDPDYDDGSPNDEPLRYAPKKARRSETESAQTGESTPWRRSRPQSGGGGAGSSGWSGGGRTGTAFPGEETAPELRSKLELAPDRLPEPPPHSSSSSSHGFAWAGRLTGLVVVAGVGFFGYQWGSSPSSSRLPPPQQQGYARPPAATPVDRSMTAAAPEPAGGFTVMNAVPAVYPPPGRAAPSPGTVSPPPGKAVRRLTVGNAPPRPADDAAPLSIAVDDAGVNAAVMITGLAPGSALSAGREIVANTWQVPVENLPGLSVTPPRGFAGAMDLTVELQSSDGGVPERRSVQLEWLPNRSIAKAQPQPQPRQHDAAEIAQMLNKGADLMANGDVAAARLMYQRAAEAGDAAAAFALAESYDPLVLAKAGIPPDVGLAQAWYTKAKALGSAQAWERLDRLAHMAVQ